MTDTPDLRTLAAEAIWADGMGPVMGTEALADAVLAAVLPAHRRQVLAEAEREVRHRADSVPWSDPTLRRGIQYAALTVAVLARGPASAAPETAPRPRQDDETAPAVGREAAQAQGPTEGAAPDVCDSKAPSLLPSEPDRYCTLPLGHRGWHREGAMQWRDAAAPAGPRTWALPDDREVTARIVVVVNRRRGSVHGMTADNAEAQRWTRELIDRYDDNLAASQYVGLVKVGPGSLFMDAAPLTDATPAGGQDGDGHG